MGSHVVDLLVQLGYEPLVVDNLQSGNREVLPPQVRFYHVDITSPQIEAVFEKEKPEVVIHLAAQVEVANSIKDPVEDAKQNILGTIRLLTCCHWFNVKKFIFSPSCAVYGEQDDQSIKETFPIQTKSFYGNSKTSINELYQMIASFSTKKIPPIFMTERKGDIRFSRLDHSKARNLLNWEPTFDLNTGLRETLKYYKTI